MAERAGRDTRSSYRRSIAGRLLTLAAVALMLIAAFYPVFGYLPGQGFRTITAIAVITALVGGGAPPGSRLALTLLWAAFGMSMALWLIGLFGVVGFFDMAAGLLLVGAILTVPNRSGLETPYDWRFVVAFAVAYVAFLGTIMI